jgi:guanylate kinase
MSQQKRRGLLFIVSAPSGAGKTSLCRAMSQAIPGLCYSVSYTTRAPRSGEMHGRDYFFISKAEFEKMVRRRMLAEWARVHGNLYGTYREYLKERLAEGVDVLLDVDAQGAAQLRKRYPDGIFIYILPPSLEDLRKRLHERGSDSNEEIERRLRQTRKEIRSLSRYGYLVVNDEFKSACRSLESIILAERSRLRPGNVNRIQRSFLQSSSKLPTGAR